MSKRSGSVTPRQLAELQRLLASREKKSKTSVSLSGELLRATDALAGKSARSAFVDRALRRYLEGIARRARHEHDLAVINAGADVANRASADLLAIQSWPK